MQIRPLSTLSALAAAPRTMRMCSCGMCSACTASAASTPPLRSSNASADGEGVQRNADGDTYAPDSGRRLNDADQARVRELEARDREVHAHENAHKAAAGGLARGGPNYQYQTGPDGKRYAVGGDVQIDTSPGRTPEETIAKAQRIRSAGLAPAQPSGADQAVVAQAAQMESGARAEKSAEASDDSRHEKAGPGRSTGGARSIAPRLDLVA